MIYIGVEEGSSISQGDIFRNVPRVEVSLHMLPVVEHGAIRQCSWKEAIGAQPEAVTATLPLEAVTAIVLGQDCDNARASHITLAQVLPFREVLAGIPKNANSWRKKITQHAKANYRYFYLPIDEGFGFAERMSADFRLLFQVPREDLEANTDLRMGRLVPHALEHFRESIAHFFRRYAYDEWYPLSREEFAAYKESMDEEIKPYPYQE